MLNAAAPAACSLICLSRANLLRREDLPQRFYRVGGIGKQLAGQRLELLDLLIGHLHVVANLLEAQQFENRPPRFGRPLASTAALRPRSAPDCARAGQGRQHRADQGTDKNSFRSHHKKLLMARKQ